jgi:transposase
MEDVLNVYHQPRDEHRPLVCMDEMSKQLTQEVREPLPAQPGQPQRYDSEYKRNGVANLFIAFAPLEGWRHLEVTQRRARPDWAHFARDLVDEHFPKAEKIILVMDNLNTHTGGSLYEAFPPEEAQRILDRLEIHYTPKHGSWLNMAEGEFSVLRRQCLDRRIPDMETLRRETEVWQAERNAKKAGTNWQFTTPDARVKLRRLYPSFDD